MGQTGDASGDFLGRLIRLVCASLGRGLQPGFGNDINHIAYTLALMWRLEHPANALRGDPRLPEAAARQCDRHLGQWRAEGVMGTNEWNAFAAAYCDAMLAGVVADDRRAGWREMATRYLDAQMTRPFFYTSYNHEVQRCLTLYRVGELYERDDYRRRAVFFARQLLRFATDQGFWEEGPHHGPSMSYNDIMLPGLAWMYRLTGEEAFGAAAGRLADFQATHNYPDGTTSGAFDGRVGTKPAWQRAAVSGLELSPVGRTLMARQLAAAEERFESGLDAGERIRGHFVALAVEYYHRFGCGAGDGPTTGGDTGVPPVRPIGIPAHGAGRQDQQRPTAETAVPLDGARPHPLDEDGAVVESHAPHFDGLAARRGPWVVALSSQRSEVPKLMHSVFRLDRQSRIELWHEKLWIVVGGGHNKCRQPVPLANAVVYSGFGNVGVDFGRIAPADPDRPARALDLQATYLARVARTFMDGGAATLELDFAHARIRFRVRLEADGAAVDWRFEQRGAKVLALQLPVVVCPASRLLADGKEMPKQFGPPEATPCQAVEVAGPAGRFAVSARGGGARTCLRWPLLPVITYRQDDEETFRAAPFHVGLLSTQWADPPESGEGGWAIACRP